MNDRHENSQASLLVVDDDALLRSVCAKTLRHAGFEVHLGRSAVSADTPT